MNQTLLRFFVDDVNGGVLGPDELVEELADAVDAPDSPLVMLEGERVADRAHLAERLVLTHRLSEEEVAEDRLHLTPDWPRWRRRLASTAACTPHTARRCASGRGGDPVPAGRAAPR